MNGPETGEYPTRPETLTTGQPAIKGYRNLTALEVDLMNAIKASGEDLGQLIEVVQQHLGRQNIAAMASSDPDEAKRTSPQNARHWALLTEAAKHIGCSAEDLHEDLLCQHYGFEEIQLPSGRIVRKPLKRSSARNVKEFALFMEFCEAFLATELGVWA